MIILNSVRRRDEWQCGMGSRDNWSCGTMAHAQMAGMKAQEQFDLGSIRVNYQSEGFNRRLQPVVVLVSLERELDHGPPVSAPHSVPE